MKKYFLFFALCVLPACASQAQGVCSYVKNDTLTAVTATIVRPFEGTNSIIYTYGSGAYAYIAFSDANGVLHKAALPQYVRLKDIRVLNEMVYCCGTDLSTGEGIIGYFQATELMNNTLSATWLAIPDIQYVDYVEGGTGIWYSTFCVNTFEIVDNNSAFPHMIFLGDMEANGDTITGLSEIVTLTGGQIMCGSIFTPYDVEHYHDLALTDNYVYSVPVKGPNSHSNYQVRQMPRNIPLILYSLRASFPSYTYETEDTTTVFPDSLLIEAGGGDDFLVVYHSDRDTDSIMEVSADFFSASSFAQTPPVSLWSASLDNVGMVFSWLKMYDLRYNANQASFDLLQAVSSASTIRDVKISSSMQWPLSYVSGCQLLSICHENTQGKWLSTGCRISDGSLIACGENYDAPRSCKKQITAQAETRPIVFLLDHVWAFGFDSQSYVPLPSTMETAVEIAADYMCKKVY